MASIKKIEGKNGVSYKITVSCGYDVKGKKIIETATFKPDAGLTPKKMEKAAQDFAHEFESRVKSGAAMDGRKVTLQVFADRWIEEYAKPKLQPGTVRKYREELDDKILPAIGHYKLSEIKPHTVNAFFLSLTKDGARKDGKAGGYSKGSITKTRNVLSSILRTATEWEIIDRNPCDKVRVQAESTADKLKFFTPELAAAFLQYIEQPYTVRVGGHTRIDDTGTPYTVGDYEITKNMQEQIKLLFNLAIYTGLRKGELLALKWSDIDFQRNVVQVSKAVTVVDGKQVCKTPKTKSSYRTVSFPQFLAARLKALQRSELAQRFRFGQDWQGEDWIFVQDNGKMMSYSTPYEAFQDAIRRYNDGKAAEDQLPLIPFHGLRHTSATLMIASRQDEKNRVKQTRPRANLDHDEHLCPRLAGKRPQSSGHYRKSTLKRGMSAKKSRSSSQIVAKWLFGTGSRFKAKRKSLDFQGFFCIILCFSILLKFLQSLFYYSIFYYFLIPFFIIYCSISYRHRSFTTSPAMISPATDGTNATLPGISRRSVHLCSAPGGQIQFVLQLIAISSIGLVGCSSE